MGRDGDLQKEGRKNRTFNVRRWLTTGPSGVLLAVLVLSIALTTTTDNFLSIKNIEVLSYSVSTLAVVGFAQMVVLAAGGMNASVGAIGGLVAVLVGGLMESYGISPSIAIVAGLSIGAVCGVLNGILIVRMRLSPFIITLATGSVFTGINLGMTSGQPFYNLPESFRHLGVWNVAGVPGLVIIMLVIAVALHSIFRSTGIGRQILAIGANARTAELAGVQIGRSQVVVNALSGFLAASSAIILTARIGAAQPSIGNEWMLASFAAPIIGGTSLLGGSLSVLGTILGALLLTISTNGLVHLGIDVFWKELFSGLIILGAGGVDLIRILSSRQLDREQRLAIFEPSASSD